MTGVAGIWDASLIGLGGCHKSEGVTSHIRISDRLRNFRHVAGDTVIPRASGLVMRVRLNRGCARAIR